MFEMQPRWMKAIEYVDPLPKSKRGKSSYWRQNSDIVRMYGHMDDYPLSMSSVVLQTCCLPTIEEEEEMDDVDQWPEVD